MNRLKSLDEIAISHGIQLKKDLALINKSYHENNQIVQGEYDSEYRKIMDFFHELTYLLCDDYFRKLERVINDNLDFFEMFKYRFINTMEYSLAEHYNYSYIYDLAFKNLINLNSK